MFKICRLCLQRNLNKMNTITEYKNCFKYEPKRLAELEKNGLIIYLSGSITNDKDYLKKFTYYSMFFEDLGYLVLNPVQFCMGIQKWSVCMRICLEAIKYAHFMVVLDTHIKSRGRDMEIHEAEKLKIPVIDAKSFNIRFDNLDYEFLLNKNYPDLNYLI